MSSKKENKKKYEDLIEEIKKYDIEYHKGTPIVSDAVYDFKYKELLELEKQLENTNDLSPTLTLNHYKKILHSNVNHMKDMKSIENMYNEEDLKRFFNRVSDFGGKELSVEHKLDGVAAAIKYKKGKLESISTRGDGTVGEDITLYKYNIEGVQEKITLKKDIEIYGEIIIKNSSFKAMNKKRILKGEKPWVNSRNLVAGSLRLLDINIAKDRNLTFISYGVNDFENFKNQIDIQNFLLKNKFIVNQLLKVVSSLKEAYQVIKNVNEERINLDYEIDGLVFKAYDCSIRQNMGFSAKFYKWQAAYKLSSNTTETIVNNIFFQVGRSGRITPVAELQPIFLGGVTISKATLHNYSELRRLDVRKGDIVEISRGGDVIPKIIKVITKDQKNREKPIKIPSICPSCGSNLNHSKDLKLIRCENKECINRFIKFLQNFVSRDFMNIKTLGNKILEKLVEHNIISKVTDIYKMNKEQIAGIDGLGDLVAKNILESVENSKNRPAYKLLASMGIEGIGVVKARKLLEHFKSIKNIMESNEEELNSIHNFGSVNSSKVFEFFKKQENIDTFNEFIKIGLNTKIEEGELPKSCKTFCITGKLEGLSRTQMKDKIEKLGHKFSSSVTNECDYLICGKDGGSKIKEASKKRIPIITLKDFEKMMKVN